MEAWAVIHRSVEAMRFAQVAALCCSCSDDGWVCASVQHLQGQRGGLEAGEGVDSERGRFFIAASK
mgnify:CR=1 FL=1